MLDVDILHRQGAFQLDCRFASNARITGLFGPSGAGKSTLLRILAGLLEPDRGRVELAGRCVFDSARRYQVPAHDRRIGFVFQQPRLFAHLNVRHNLTYGTWFAGRGRQHDAPSFDRVVEMLDIGALLNRRVSGLSGGEQQRVAIGRALLANPAVLLLDEPLASLDTARKEEVLPYIERMSAETRLPIVYVSHQLDELLRLARHQVVVLREGAVAFSGPTAEFLARPDLLAAMSAYDAGALLRLRVMGHQPADGLSLLDCAGQPLYVPRLERDSGEMVTLHVRARDVMLARRHWSEISALNALAARIESIEAQDDYSVNVILSVGEHTLSARITRRSARLLTLAPGDSIHAIIKSLALAEQSWRRLEAL